MIRAAAALTLCGIYAAGLAAPWLRPAGYATQYREAVSAPPSTAFPLGTDDLGRDRLARLLHGTRISMTLAPAAALLATCLAAVIGGSAGYLGGWLEAAITRAADLFVSLPWLLLLLTARAILPLNVPAAESLIVTFAILGFAGWAAPARIVAAAVGSMRTADWMIQGRARGCRGSRLIVVHLLPNLRSILVAQFWISVPVFILSEASLGFLGLGVGEPMPSWGSLLRGIENFDAVRANPWMLSPLALMVMVVACFHALVSTKEATQ